MQLLKIGWVTLEIGMRLKCNFHKRPENVKLGMSDYLRNIGYHAIMSSPIRP